MQEGQLTSGQMLSALMGVAQLMGSVDLEHQGHGIHREVTAREILLNGSGAHHRVLSWCGVGLRAGTGHIEQHTIKLQFGSAELRMQLQVRHTRLTEVILQMPDKFNT